jgi:hypothetical protein
LRGIIPSEGARDTFEGDEFFRSALGRAARPLLGVFLSSLCFSLFFLFSFHEKKRKRGRETAKGKPCADKRVACKLLFTKTTSGSDEFSALRDRSPRFPNRQIRILILL